MMVRASGSDRVDEFGRAYAGSMLQLQIYVNRRASELNSAIAGELVGLGERATSLVWRSPVESDGFSEYQDRAFVERLGLGHLGSRLSESWPRRGPVWDGLAVERDPGSAVLLVEAKSYPTESLGACGTSSPTSLHTIKQTLSRTADWLGLDSYNEASWLGERYQAANRLGHLYILREEWGIEAYLLYGCFVDDPRQATSEEEWKEAVRTMWSELGLRAAPPHSGAVFLAARPRAEFLV